MNVPNVKALLALCRASNLPTVWMNVLTAAVLSNAAAPNNGSAVSIVLLMLALSCFYCGGMALNDVCDLEYDSLHQRYRPIPAGRISLAQARAVTALLFVLGMAGLLPSAHGSGMVAGLILLAAIWIYDLFHKRFPATVLVMACARLLVYVVAAQALVGDMFAVVWLAAGLQALYVLLLTVVARLESRTAARRYSWPVIPWMIAAMPLMDGAVLALHAGAKWLLAGLLATALTRLGQRYVRGD